jgi:hypothetical protein
MRAIRIGGVAIAIALSAWRAGAVPFELVYLDPPGQGFNDPALGAARRAALEYAVGIWSARLEGEIPIMIHLEFRGFGGSATGGFLAGAQPINLHAGFPNAPLPTTWFVSAAANQLAGVDLLPSGADSHDIDMVFNSDLDNPVVLGEAGWHYALDAMPTGGDVDFVTVALHEIAHGLGFLSFIRPATGEFFANLPDVYSARLTQMGVGDLTAMNDAARKASLNSEQLFFIGPSATEAFGAPVKIYAPFSFRPGSSVSHLDTSHDPDQLMEPFILFATHGFGVTLPALEDLGWTALPPPLSARRWTIYRDD